MKRKSRFFIIIGLAAAMIAGTLLYGVVVNAKTSGEFSEDGYVLGSVKTNDSEKAESSYYFAQGTKYKKKFPQKLVFEQRDGDKAAIDRENFAHYMNDDLQSFANGVFFDVDSLSGNALSYYNISAESIMQRQGESYSLSASDKSNEFKNFIWKISQEKYMAVSDAMVIHMSEGTEVEVSGYIEINFVDKNVAQLINQEKVFQTVGADAYIQFPNGARLYLSDKTIFLDDEEKLTLAQMVIDSDDNIEIVQKSKRDEADDKEETSGSSSVSNSSKSSNQQTVVSGGGTAGNGGGTAGSGGESGEVDTDAAFPTYEITEMDTDVMSVQADIEITDDDGLLSEGGTNYYIIEKGTNKIIYQTNSDAYNIKIGTSVLSPDTEYTLVANADYTYKDETYNKDFISQVFRTDSTGISFHKSYIDEEQLELTVSVESYSSITSARIAIFKSDDMDNEIEEKSLPIGGIKENTESSKVTFGGLEADTQYTVVLDNMSVSGVSAGDIKLSRDYQTLKVTPTIGLPKYTLNQAKSSVILYLDKAGDGNTGETDLEPIIDPNEGVKSCTFEIYLQSQLNGDGEPEGSPIRTINAGKSTSTEVSIDDKVMMRNVAYCYQVSVEFYDNEKEIQLRSTVSSPFSLNTAKYPSVEFVADKEKTDDDGVVIQGIGHDRFTGTVIIHDDSNVVLKNNNMVTMSITANDGGTVQVKQWTIDENSNLTSPINVTGLRANTTYTVSLRGMANLSDPSNPDDMEIYLGSFQVTTGTPNKIQANVTPTDSPSLTQAFDVNFNLSKLETADGKTVNNYYEMTTANSIQLVLYEGNPEDNKVWGTKLLANSNTSYNPMAYAYNSTIKDDYCDNELLITPTTFGRDNSAVTADKYTLVVKNGTDYTEHENAIEIVAEGETAAEFKIIPHGFVPSLPNDVNNALKVNAVSNGAQKDSPVNGLKYDPNLKGSTIVGYTVNANTFPANGMQFAKSITYKAWRISEYDKAGNPVYDTSGNPVLTTTKEVIKGASSLPDWVVPVEAGNDQALERGHQYFFTYEVSLNLSPNSPQETLAAYPADALNGTVDGKVKVLRSSLQSCQKETPTISMYLKNTQKSEGTYTQHWVYKYSDVDEAYTSEKVKVTNGSNGSTVTYADWNVDYDGGASGEKLLTITGLRKNNSNTLKVEKQISLFEPIKDYAGATSYDLLATQPIIAEDVSASVNKLDFNVDYDASRLKVVLDVSGSNTQYMSSVSALKVTVERQDGTGKKVTFDYLPLDSNYMAYIPLTQLSQFRGVDIKVNAEAYCDTGLMGTDFTGNTDTSPVLLTTYTRSGNYQYINSADDKYTTAAKSLYKVSNSFVSSIFDSDSKSFTANRLFNSKGLSDYGGTAQSYSYMLDKQGMNSKTTSSNPATDTYYIFRQTELTELKTTEVQTKFNYILPSVSNIKITPGVTDAKVEFDYNGAEKSAVVANKIYLKYTDQYGNYIDNTEIYEINLKSEDSGSGHYEVDLSKYMDGADGALMEPGKTYYFTLTANFKADGDTAASEMKLLNIDKEDQEVLEAITTVAQVNFGTVGYSYINNSYGNKVMSFSYAPSLTAGYSLTFTLTDTTTGKVIDLGDAGNVSIGQITTDMRTNLQVGNGESSAIPGKKDLVYGNRYKLTAAATTLAGDSVGAFSKSFVLSELDDPFFTVTSIASVGKSEDGTQDQYSITYNLVGNDLDFAMKGEKYTVKIYKGDGSDLSGKPIYDHGYNLPVAGKKHQPKTAEAITLNELEKNTKYTMVITADVDSKYDGNTKKYQKTYTTRTLNDYGIAFGNAYATPVPEATDLRLDFYDCVGFTNIKTLNYTIYPASASGTPVSGEINPVSFSNNGEALSVTLAEAMKGQSSGRYTIKVYLKNADAVVVGEREIDFLYSPLTAIKTLMQLIQ